MLITKKGKCLVLVGRATSGYCNFTKAMEKQEQPTPQAIDLANIIVEKDFEDAFNEFLSFAENVQSVDPAWESFLSYTPRDPAKDHLKIWRQLDKESGLYKCVIFRKFFQLLSKIQQISDFEK